jgi:hypothetical protein
MSFAYLQFSPTAFLRLMKSRWSQRDHVRPNRRGRFFRAKAEKKIAPDESAKACLYSTEQMPTPKGWVSQSAFQPISIASKRRQTAIKHGASEHIKQ